MKKTDTIFLKELDIDFYVIFYKLNQKIKDQI